MATQDLDEHLAPEQWRFVTDNRDYEISDFGNVRRATHAKGTAVGRPLIPRVTSHGYPMVTLCGPGKARTAKAVHRLVAEAFLERDPARPNVNHKNFDKADCRAANLEWVTQRENILHAVAGGRFPVFDRKGVKNGNSKLTDDDVRAIRDMRERWVDVATIADRFSISQYTVWEIAARRQWRHVI